MASPSPTSGATFLGLPAQVVDSDALSCLKRCAQSPGMTLKDLKRTGDKANFSSICLPVISADEASEGIVSYPLQELAVKCSIVKQNVWDEIEIELTYQDCENEYSWGFEPLDSTAGVRTLWPVGVPENTDLALKVSRVKGPYVLVPALKSSIPLRINSGMSDCEILINMANVVEDSVSVFFSYTRPNTFTGKGRALYTDC